MQPQIKDLYQKFKESSGISTDSRTMKKDNIFFCLSGDNFDGNDYAEDALNKGASLCVIDNPESVNLVNPPIIIIEKTKIKLNLSQLKNKI